MIKELLVFIFYHAPMMAWYAFKYDFYYFYRARVMLWWKLRKLDKE
jgi:hypothetical protein